MHDIIKKLKKIIKENVFAFFWTGIFVVIIGITFFPKALKYSETPQFCASCHVMKKQYESWLHSKHRGFKCVDCHLPNDNIVNHYIWKSIDGTKDLISNTLGLKDEDEIFLSNHGHKVLQQNCIRCHKDMVDHIDTKRSCIDCHRTEKHRNTALFCSLNTEVEDEKNK